MTPLDIEGTLSAHQSEQLWKAGGWAGDTACSCGWRMAMWSRKDFPPEHRAHVAAVLREQIGGALAEPLALARRVEADMSEQAMKAWRSADARRGLADHDALIVHADALTRWSERFRMAFAGDYYRSDTERAGGAG